jgi:hypothetical protein
MTDIVSVCNQAIAQSGARVQISDLNEDSTEANYCNLLYQPTFTQLARSAFWNCLRGQIPLTLLKAAQGTPENQTGTTLPIPPQPWLYEYLLPPDCLMVRYLQPTFVQQAGAVPLFPTASAIPPTIQPRTKIPFVVATDVDISLNRQKVILTNLAVAQLVYTVNEPNPEFWDSQFQAAYVASLAAFLIPPLNMNMGLLNTQIKIADGIIATARATDGNETTISQDREADWITARGCGQYIGNDYGCGYGGSGYTYGVMSWPSG